MTLHETMLKGRCLVTAGSPGGPNTTGLSSAGISYMMSLHDSQEGKLPRQETGTWYVPSITARLLSPPALVSYPVRLGTRAEESDLWRILVTSYLYWSQFHLATQHRLRTAPQEMLQLGEASLRSPWRLCDPQLELFGCSKALYRP